MVKRMGGSRHKTRYKLQRAPGQRGKLRLTARLTKYAVGDRVALVAESSEPRGLFFPRHHGKTGVVTGTQGAAYFVTFHDKNKEKTVVTLPIHMKRA